MAGAAASFQFKQLAAKQHRHRHFFATQIELAGTLLVAILSFLLPDLWTVALFGFFAAIQADTFTKLRGMPYATVMSTGNLKSTANFLYGGLTTGNHALIEKGKNAGAVVLSFALGAFLSVLLNRLIGNVSVFGIPLLLLVILVMIREVGHDVEEIREEISK
jgi:uncharacterized membrane protein YoaK (UPF0700 family)